MKTLFFTFFAPFVIASTAMAAPKAASVALDTVRTTYDDGRVARIYTVLKGSIRMGLWRLKLRIRMANWKVFSVRSMRMENCTKPSAIGMVKKKGLVPFFIRMENEKVARLIIAVCSTACPKNGLKMEIFVAKFRMRMDKFMVL